MRALKPLSIDGLALIVLGLIALAYQGITYTSRETVLDVGPIPRHRGSAENAAASTGLRDCRRRWPVISHHCRLPTDSSRQECGLNRAERR
jgi:hypothetical protein